MNEQSKQEIGKRIIAALAARDIKQKELAAAIGVKANVISFFCTGARVPNTEQVIAIAKALKVSTDYLLCLTDNMTEDKDLDAVCSYTGLDEAAIQMLRAGTDELRGWFINSFMNLVSKYDYSKALFRDLYLYLNSGYTTLINIPEKYGMFNLPELTKEQFYQDCLPIKQLISVSGNPKGEFDYIGSHSIDNEVLEGLYLMSAIKDLNRIKEECTQTKSHK